MKHEYGLCAEIEFKGKAEIMSDKILSSGKGKMKFSNIRVVIPKQIFRMDNEGLLYNYSKAVIHVLCDGQEIK